MNIVERSKDILLEIGAAPILYLMLALSVLSVAVMLERAWFFFVSSEDLGSLARALEDKLAQGDLAGARALTEGSRSVEGGIVRAGLASSKRGGLTAAHAGAPEPSAAIDAPSQPTKPRRDTALAISLPFIRCSLLFGARSLRVRRR